MQIDWPDIFRTFILGEAVGFLFLISLLFKRFPKNPFEQKCYNLWCYNTLLVVSLVLAVLYMSLVTILSIGEGFTFKSPLAFTSLTLAIFALYQKFRSET